MKHISPPIQLSLFDLPEDRSPQKLPVLRSRHTRKDRPSSPCLKRLWLHIRREWFPHHPDLDQYKVCWSTRSQLRTLASCCFGSKRISVARELSYKKCAQWLEPLLYHEMCHVYLDTTDHSKEFKVIENRHPLINLFDNWIDSGGWDTAIRSDRAKRSYKRRRKTEARTNLFK